MLFPCKIKHAKLHPDVILMNFSLSAAPCNPVRHEFPKTCHAFLLLSLLRYYTWKESSLQYKCNKSYGTCNKLPSWIVIPPVFQKKSPFRMFGKDYPFSVCDCIHNLCFSYEHEQCRDADSRINSVSIRYLACMPQNAKHSQFQSCDQPCFSAKMLLFLFIQLPVLAVHGTE